MGRARDVAYGMGLALTSPAWVPWALARGLHRGGWRGRWGTGAPLPDPTRPRVLVHAVSMGEVASVTGLVPALHDSGLETVVSTTTDTGTGRARALFGDRSVVRFPFDFSGSVRRFLDRVRPDLVALVELEVWPNLIEECRNRGIPVVVVSGRISERSAPRYRKIGALLRASFEGLDRVAAQNEVYAQRFQDLGVPADRIHVTGSLKWDAAPVRDTVPGQTELAALLGIDPGRPLVVAGSTGPGEEELLARTWPPDVQLLVAPRKPERFDEAAQALGPTVIRRSDPTNRPDGSTHIYLLDSLGELERAYALASLAIVGRSFNGQAGSNPIEPAALGRAVVMGPDHADFRESVRALEAGGGLQLVAPERVVKEACALARDPDSCAERGRRAQATVRAQQGATLRTVSLIRDALAGP